MSAPRLPFLWPMLYRPLRAPREPLQSLLRISRPSRGLTVAARRPQGSPTQRYGTAQEPAPHLREKEAKKETVDQTVTLEQEKLTDPVEEEEEDEAPTIAFAPRTSTSTGDTTEAVPQEPAPEPPRAPDSKPLETVLHMPSPAEEEQRKPPHLKTPPYVHHFDTYGLVKDLVKSGFSQDQAVTIMKALRGILADNMELAREGLVSKSNVENETYLFRAACSELRTEIGNNRKSEMEKMRTERNQLQHEVDILNQKLSQETGGLKDELKGLFDDRKMAVRQEQRGMESKIQELNYKITVALNSDARSEVEGLRWVLTRRAAITIGVSALMLFAALRYSSYVMHVQNEEKKKAEKKQSPPGQGQNNSNGDSSNGYGSSGMRKEDALGGELLVAEGGVSLS